MAEWYVKDLSKLTGVSVQTLHHYDRIHLLKPSLRQLNGYRVYSENDLLRLQQILALKFFGFELVQIQKLLSEEVNAFEHFSVQAKLLEQKANNLLEAVSVLRQVAVDAMDNKSIRWESIVKLIEVYRMTQKLEHAWVKEIFTPEELKQYADFENEFKNKSTPEKKAAFEKNWSNLIADIRDNLHLNPTSAIGIAIGKKCMQWINGVYGKKYAHLRTKKFEKGFAESKGLEEVGMTPEMVSWLDKAMDAYWRERIYGILAEVGKTDPEKLLQRWQEVLDDMYGDDNARKAEIYNLAIMDEKVSEKAKIWIKSMQE